MFCDFNFMFIFKIIFLINLVSTTLQQQKSCTNPNGTPGVCVSIYYCNSLKETIQRNPLTEEDRQFILGSRCFDGFGPLPLVCCTNEGMKNNSINEDTNIKPLDHYFDELNKNQDGTKLPKLPYCGSPILDDRIYNGKNAALGEFPWMVLLEYRRKNGDIVQNCAGSLINSKYVLTAAHCLTGKIETKIGPLISIRLGEHDLGSLVDCTDETICADPIQTVEVEELIPHEEYDDNIIHRYNDIGLIRLKNHVNFTSYISPVCLPSIVNLVRTAPGKQLTVSGWGRTTSTAKSEIKQKLPIPVVEQDDCTIKYATQKVNIIDKQLCAGGVFYEDSCDGDSGGPLMNQIKNNWVIEGIVSFGYKCGLESWPAIYTRVSSYEDWIKSKLKP